MKHEHVGPHEIFAGNTQEGEEWIAWLKARGVTTARLGSIALCIEGKALPEQYRPVFINRSDEGKYHDVMMSKTFGVNWRTSVYTG